MFILESLWDFHLSKFVEFHWNYIVLLNVRHRLSIYTVKQKLCIVLYQGLFYVSEHFPTANIFTFSLTIMLLSDLSIWCLFPWSQPTRSNQANSVHNYACYISMFVSYNTYGMKLQYVQRMYCTYCILYIRSIFMYSSSKLSSLQNFLLS